MIERARLGRRFSAALVSSLDRYELDGKYRDNLHVVRIDNYDFVCIDEIQKTLPVWINLHQGFGDSDKVDSASG